MLSLNDRSDSILCWSIFGVQLLQHENYLDKINNLPIPLEHPKCLCQSYTYDTSNLL